MRATVILAFFSCYTSSEAFLYPRDSETREVKSLNGIWLFNFGSNGFDDKWYERDFTHIADYDYIPVPSSFNEVTGLPMLRDYVGWFWYQKQFFLSKAWNDSRIFVYFGAVDHHAIVWCNGVKIGGHSGGHVPFHLEMTGAIRPSHLNFLTVAVNNTLTPTSLPQGYYSYPNDSSKYPPGTFTYRHNCDYFDYAGINRNVFLYSVPNVFIKDIDVVPNYFHDRNIYSLTYDVKIVDDLPATCFLKVTDRDGKETSFVKCKNEVHLNIVRPCYPMVGECLVTLEIVMEHGSIIDVYRMEIGFKSLEWGSEGLKINGEHYYLNGFGMHEDSDLRGRGYDDVTSVRDISLLKWTAAKVIRTSHYPYSEEFLMLCDTMAIAVILEVPACSLDNFTKELYDEHERVTLEIISKYKHHPSIIMWSLANEPASYKNSSASYFKKLYEAAKSADPTRPITFVTSQSVNREKAAGFMDFILINRYSGWYQNGGRLDLIEYQIRNEIKAWNDKFKKPVIVSEYGAGSISGSHELNPSMWTEDYQVSLLQKHFAVFDDLKMEGLLAGEMIWNLIDFKTPQEYFRPGFCMKGVFTRQRQPKAAAKIIRERYMKLSNNGYFVIRVN